MSDSQGFEHESIQNAQTIGAYLRALIEGFESGRITLETEDRQVVLQPGNHLQFAVKARKKGTRSKLTLKLSWKDHPEETLINKDFLIK